MVFSTFCTVAAVVILPIVVANHQPQPNVLFILTDDQDYLLDSMREDGPCQTILQSLGGSNGTVFTNAFVNTPICCPSRAEVTTGRYMHK